MSATDSPELQAYKEQAKQSVNHFFDETTLLLKALHVKRVRISYQGSGDDGGIESTSCSMKSSDEGDPGTNWKPLADYLADDKLEAFESMIYDVMTAYGAGFNEEGCYGEIEWNIEDDTFVHDLSYYVQTTEDHKFVGLDNYINPPKE